MAENTYTVETVQLPLTNLRRFCGLSVKPGYDHLATILAVEKQRFLAGFPAGPWLMIRCPHGRQVVYDKPQQLPRVSTRMPCEHDCWAIWYG